MVELLQCFMRGLLYAYSPMPQIPPVGVHIPEEARVLKTHRGKPREINRSGHRPLTQPMQPLDDDKNSDIQEVRS